MSVLSLVPWVPHPSRVYRYLHSRFRRLDVERETIDGVLRHYRLKVTRQPRNLPMGWRNHCIVVDTDAGRKVLKQYRPQWNLGAVSCEHSILTRLAQLDIAATRVVATSKGETWVVRPDGIFALFDFIEGSTYSLTVMSNSHRQELVGLTGKGLARIHRHLCGFIPEGKHHLGFRSYEGSRQRASAWYAERVAHLVERTRQLPIGEAKEMAGPLVQAGNDVIAELHSLDTLLGAANLPRTVIHGDYGFHNLIFHDGPEITVLDFELSRIEWRMYDIVMVLTRAWRSGMWKEFPTRMRAFLAGYESEYPLEPIERRLFNQIWTMQNLQLAVKNWDSYFKTGFRLERLSRATNALSVARDGSTVANHVLETSGSQRDPEAPNDGRDSPSAYKNLAISESPSCVGGDSR